MEQIKNKRYPTRPIKKYSSKKALSICVKGSKMWNALSADIKLSRNVNIFKKMLKASLLENYKFWNSEQYDWNLCWICSS